LIDITLYLCENNGLKITKENTLNIIKNQQYELLKLLIENEKIEIEIDNYCFYEAFKFRNEEYLILLYQRNFKFSEILSFKKSILHNFEQKMNINFH
jgi:hypothetical protein